MLCATLRNECIMRSSKWLWCWFVTLTTTSHIPWRRLTLWFLPVWWEQKEEHYTQNGEQDTPHQDKPHSCLKRKLVHQEWIASWVCASFTTTTTTFTTTWATTSITFVHVLVIFERVFFHFTGVQLRIKFIIADFGLGVCASRVAEARVPITTTATISIPITAVCTATTTGATPALNSHPRLDLVIGLLNLLKLFVIPTWGVWVVFACHDSIGLFDFLLGCTLFDA